MADLTALRAIPAERARLDARELALIDRSRREGATWAEVAEALGLGSRQAAEQRRLRLTSAVHPVAAELDLGLGAEVAVLRAATAELHRRVGADRRWDRRFTRAALVRQTLAAAPEAPVSALYALVAAAVADLSAAGAPLPAPTRAAVTRLRSALEAATPQP
jgi:phosphoglycolate phosphatase-like HAD superfamily hydrolase